MYLMMRVEEKRTCQVEQRKQNKNAITWTLSNCIFLLLPNQDSNPDRQNQNL